jgi:hypothetical protein
MSRTTHTAGPWTYDDCGDGQILITPANDLCLYVADINSQKQDPEGRYPTKAKREANAYLIAAAPELLAAIEDIVKRWESGDLAAAVRHGAAMAKKARGAA